VAEFDAFLLRKAWQ